MDRSNSANAPTIRFISRRAGVVVSIAPVKLRNPALASDKPFHDREGSGLQKLYDVAE